MRFRVPLLFALVTAGSLALPYLAHAAGIPFFGPIIPPENPTCALGWGSVLVVVNNIITFALTMVIVFIAPIMIAYCGFLFVVNPVNPAGKERAKGILLNVVVGIVIALAAWLIVDAVMVALTGGGVSKWSEVIGSHDSPACLDQKGAKVATPTEPPGVRVTPPAPPSAPPAPSTTPDKLTNINGFFIGPQCGDSNTKNVKILAETGVRGFSSGSCCSQNTKGCTSLSGMRQSTINHIKEIRRTCGNVTVTGGTEVGHSDNAPGGLIHESGYKVDLARNIDSCINKNTTAVGTRNDGGTTVPLRKDRCNNIYAQETSHWDITVGVLGCSLL